MALSKLLGSRQMRIGYAAGLMIVVAAITAKMFVGQVHAGIPSYNVNEERVAIKGYDTVAYFLKSAAVKGSGEFAHRWQDAYWHFSSASNRDLFVTNPERYAPQFGGYCAMGIALGKIVDVDPEAWTIVNGQLYLNKSMVVRDATWRKEKEKHLAQAQANWNSNRAELRDER